VRAGGGGLRGAGGSQGRRAFFADTHQDDRRHRSAELEQAGTSNYLAAAWRARDRLAAAAGREIPRGAVGLAVNPPHARTQDQFHIHIECLRPDVFRSLNAAAERITDTWSTLTVGGAHYEALRIVGEDLDGANPFELLAKHAHAAGDYTLVLAGMQFRSGAGFTLLASTGPAGELLLDSTCAVAPGAVVPGAVVPGRRCARAE
jgi:CDP-diacylglycerol pyrophosphatase